MTEHDIAYKYVHGLHDALTDSQEKTDMANDIINFAKEYHKKQLLIHGVVLQSEQLACDCDRQPLRYNELGTCKYCGKQKPSKG